MVSGNSGVREQWCQGVQAAISKLGVLTVQDYVDHGNIQAGALNLELTHINSMQSYSSGTPEWMGKKPFLLTIWQDEESGFSCTFDLRIT